MANTDGDVTGGGATAENFIEYDGGIGVDWTYLATTVFGTLWLGFAAGWMDAILRTFESVWGLIDGFAEFLADVVSSALGVLPPVVNDSLRETEQAIGSSGVLAFVVGVVVLVLLMYVGERWVRRLA